MCIMSIATLQAQSDEYGQRVYQKKSDTVWFVPSKQHMLIPSAVFQGNIVADRTISKNENSSKGTSFSSVKSNINTTKTTENNKTQELSIDLPGLFNTLTFGYFTDSDKQNDDINQDVIIKEVANKSLPSLNNIKVIKTDFRMSKKGTTLKGVDLNTKDSNIDSTSNKQTLSKVPNMIGADPISESLNSDVIEINKPLLEDNSSLKSKIETYFNKQSTGADSNELEEGGLISDFINFFTPVNSPSVDDTL